MVVDSGHDEKREVKHSKIPQKTNTHTTVVVYYMRGWNRRHRQKQEISRAVRVENKMVKGTTFGSYQVRYSTTRKVCPPLDFDLGLFAWNMDAGITHGRLFLVFGVFERKVDTIKLPSTSFKSYN